MDEQDTDVVVEGADDANAVEEAPVADIFESHTHVTGSADEADVASVEEGA